MSEFHSEENKVEDVSTIENHSKPEKKPGFVLKINKTFLTLVLSAVVGGTSGYVFSQGSRKSAIVYQSASESPSKTTSVQSGQGLTISQASKKAAASVVEIVTQSKGKTYGFLGGNYTSNSAGSGVIISKDGYILTNYHVIKNATSIRIKTSDGKHYNAKVIGADAKSDIAVLKVDAKNLTPATLGDSSKISIGDTAIVIGNPLGTLGGTVTDGIISATSREMVINNEAMDLIQTNASINSGNSGGGLFDGNGNLIGIVNAKDSGTTSSGATIEGLGFAIPINKAMEVANELIKNGKITTRATIGVYLQDLSTSENNGAPSIYVSQVINGSGAEKAGIQRGDRLVKADGVQLSKYSDLAKIMKNKKVGEKIKLTIERNGEQKEIDVTLTQVIDTNQSQHK
ncbi:MULTISPECIES: S1C family serine protease [Terrabacteria group]|uniref:S1C family serine protease n=1 Tax=Bacillati TaxID=1783272 RepID=UPI001939DD79|nr:MULTISPECIES: trypsin-like peptidase domain-containing protein [Terrabacteria group]MBW9212116.1 trypsin-like peptidase domain-containing protein [Trueperella sp. zg.1013]QRG87079.1 trypsin-like peptidase domain-containing protein [Bulleidia sp. zg-1006]